MDNLLKIIIALLSSGFLLYFYKEYKQYKYLKIKHDLKIYRKFHSILSDNQIILIIKKTLEGYLPSETYWRVDTLVEFVQLPQNRFLDNKINKLLSDLAFDLHEIAQLYSMCGRCNLISEREYKLIAYKDGDPIDDELLNKSTELSRNLLKSYRLFRNKVKKKFII